MLTDQKSPMLGEKIGHSLCSATSCKFLLMSAHRLKGSQAKIMAWNSLFFPALARVQPGRILNHFAVIPESMIPHVGTLLSFLTIIRARGSLWFCFDQDHLKGRIWPHMTCMVMCLQCRCKGDCRVKSGSEPKYKIYRKSRLTPETDRKSKSLILNSNKYMAGLTWQEVQKRTRWETSCQIRVLICT